LNKKADILKLDPKDGDTLVIILAEDTPSKESIVKMYEGHLKEMYDGLDLKILVLPHGTKVELIATSKLTKAEK